MKRCVKISELRVVQENKKELVDLMNSLAPEQLKLVLDYAKSLQGNIVNNEAFGYVVEHYDDTLSKLKDR